MVLIVVAVVAAACDSTRSKSASEGLGGDHEDAGHRSMRDAGSTDASEASVEADVAPSDGGLEADVAPGDGGCAKPSDCPAIDTDPANCAQALCTAGTCSYVARDADGDGTATWVCYALDRKTTIAVGKDCDDNDPSVHPGAWDGPAGIGPGGATEPPRCDGVDQDCDGLPDDQKTSDGTSCTCVLGQQQYCNADPAGDVIVYPRLDAAGNPLGACERGSQQCNGGIWSLCNGAVGASPEVCNGIDDDCDGTVDDDASQEPTYYCDADSDEWLAPDAVHEMSCEPPATGCPGTWRPNPSAERLNTDCDDTNSAINPSAEEACNGIDDNCDGQIDNPAPGQSLLGLPTNPGTTYACVNGKPAIQSCPDGMLDCDTNELNGCETSGTTLANCHACGTACPFACGASGCDPVVALAGGEFHTCVLTKSGTVACFGSNTYGQLGDGSTTERHQPVAAIDLTGATDISAGTAHTCAVATPDGTAYCWGSDADGQLGSDYATTSSATPVAVASVPAPGPDAGATLTGVGGVATGAAHTCAVLDNHHVACWGSEADGRLGGDSTTDDQTTPSWSIQESPYAFVTNGSAVAAGAAHTCMLTTTSTVECWGDNSLGQLGDGTTDANSDKARAVPGLTGVTQIAAGAGSTCAVAAGSVYCWGSNDMHQLGLPTGNSYNTPQKVDGLPSVTAVACGDRFACALAGGKVTCWGENSEGQRGDTGPATSTVKTTLSLSGQIAIAAGGFHACALDANGQVACWGWNNHGQLGRGGLSEAESVPAPIHSLSTP